MHLVETRKKREFFSTECPTVMFTLLVLHRNFRAQAELDNEDLVAVFPNQFCPFSKFI